MDSAAFESLLLSAMETPAKKTLDSLLALIATAGNPVPAEISAQLNDLWEQWSNDELDDAQGEFCVGILDLNTQDSPLFRKMLVGGVKAVLPPYLSRNPVMKSIGVRDENLPLAEVNLRLRKLLALKSGVVVFLPAAGRWGVAGAVDNINASLSLTAFNNVGGSAAIPLDIVLKEAVLLAPGLEVNRLVDILRAPVSSAEFRATVQKKALTPVTDAQMQAMAKTGCGRNMDGAAFGKYWANTAPAASASGTRRSCNGRSLKEIDLLLTKEEEEQSGTPFTDEEAAAFKTFFSNLKQDTANREAKLLASLVARLVGRSSEAQLKEMLTPLLGKAPFWPATPAKTPLDQMSVWGELAAKHLENLAAATAAIFPEEYLAESATRLPLKSLTPLCARITDELLYDFSCEHKNCSADLLLWIWKNRKKRDAELLRLVTVENVSRALSNDSLPKAWGSALRELRGLLLDNADFQKHLIAAADDDVVMFSAVLQGAIFLSPGERQSLMVKLARVSPLLRDYLENGAGQRILKAGIGVQEKTDAPAANEPNYTSVKSHKRLLQELDDIINIHVPENREALKVARAHGDFRENSEFDAAKERRNFLSRRRSELERELTRIQPIHMKSVKVEDSAVIGSEIELKYDNGETEVYLLLGAWDGDPERKFLSYRTRLGQAVLNRNAGDKIEVPGGRSCVLGAIRPLSAEIAAELDA